MPRKAIYICYPFADDPVYRTVKVRHLVRVLDKQGYLPIAVHLYLPQILQMGLPNVETPGPIRERALEYARRIVRWCDELWIFGDEMGDDGMPTLISEGMEGEIEEAKDAKMPVLGKSMHDFVPSIILKEGRDKYVNMGMDLAMSSVRKAEGGWGIKIISSSPDLSQNVMTIAQGLVIMLRSSAGEERLQEYVEDFFDMVRVLASGSVLPSRSEMM